MVLRLSVGTHTCVVCACASSQVSGEWNAERSGGDCCKHPPRDDTGGTCYRTAVKAACMCAATLESTPDVSDAGAVGRGAVRESAGGRGSHTRTASFPFILGCGVAPSEL